MDAPIYNRLKEYRLKNRVPFAMPGHKNGRGLINGLAELDVTELEETLNLRQQDDEVVKNAQKKLSDLYKSDESFIITCGSTAGIQAMLTSVMHPGKILVAGSDCHMSVINTCALCGYKIIFIPARINPITLLPSDDMDLEEFISGQEDEIKNNIGAVLVTSPNYYGICRNIEKYADECHKYNIPLLVDEAHGAHFAASKLLPKPAIQCGADMAVNSAHKTLNALTGAAYLHIKNKYVSRERTETALAAVQTSSPSYPIAASADIARSELEKGCGWDEHINYCIKLREKIQNELMINIVENDDPTRIVLNFMTYDISGFEAAKILSEKYEIDVEMSDTVNVVLITTPSNTKEDFERLYRALEQMVNSIGVRHEPLKFSKPAARNRIIKPSIAFYSDSKKVNFKYSAGEICTKTVTAYPPGIPIICPGETITYAHTLYIKIMKDAGAVFTGMDGDNIEVIA